jgi:putative oxidoreductase
LPISRRVPAGKRNRSVASATVQDQGDGMAQFMKSYEGQTYALLRIVTGFLFLWHGCSKLFGYPVPMPAGVPAFVLYVAGPIELIGGAMVMVGFQTRWAAFLCSGLMACAYWMAHGTKALLPVVNQGELAVVYCFLFLFIVARGPGMWSADGPRA